MIASLIRWHEESLAASLAQRSNEREETRQLLRAAEAKMLEARGFSQAVGVVNCLMIASDYPQMLEARGFSQAVGVVTCLMIASDYPQMLEARGFSQAVGVPLIASDCA